MKLKFPAAPKDYSHYTFWRADHQRKALFTMAAAAFALGRYFHF